MRNIEKAENFCIKYPNDPIFLVMKIIFILSLIIVFGYLTYNAQQENKIWHYILYLLTALAIIEGLYKTIIRLTKYDEICIEDDYFIVKKKNKIISKTKLEDIDVVENRPWFEFFGISSIVVKYEGKWLFHYKTNELFKKENEKLINRLKKGVKIWEHKQ
ncbi:hypothetical protein [Arcobacter vandammei]|uniref:hypothetical protein n=1 Tax=Arcobacter vandammei TaxID=2782243 RepID=UPI0018DF8E18|nr:hypothetical protein [Arcobacter vandammei]